MNRRKVLRVMELLQADVCSAYIDERNKNNARGQVSMRENQLFDMMTSLSQAYTNLTNLQQSKSIQNQFIKARPYGDRVTTGRYKKKNEHNTKVGNRSVS